MAALESKLLDGPSVGYCSSSDDEHAGDDFKVVNDADTHEANFMNRIGATSNTGPKGVIEDFKNFKEQAAFDKKRREKQVLREARRGLLEGPTDNKEQSASDDEDSLESLRRRRLAELKKIAKGRIIEIQEKDQFLSLTESSNSGLVAVLIYELNREDCERMTNLFKILASEYPSVKFARVTSTILGMSEQYRVNGVPTLQIYSCGGKLIGNYVKITDQIGIDATVKRFKKFLKKNRISLTQTDILSDSNASSSDDH